MRKKDKTDEAAVKGGLLSRLLLICGIVLLAMALAIGGYLVWQYMDAQNRYNEIQSVSGLDIKELQKVDANTKLEDLSFNWDALRAMNPDIVGWIIIPGTNINYPIVQGQDNQHYLYHLFDSTSSGTGAIFADYQNVPTLDGENNIIYGHNMLDGSMFSDIYLYSHQDFFDDHRVVYLCTPTMNYELSAIASIDISQDAPLRQFSFDDDAAFTAFVSDTLATPEASAPDLPTIIANTKTLYSLVTCETFDFSRRIVLCCIPVRSVVPTDAESSSTDSSSTDSSSAASSSTDSSSAASSSAQ